MSFKCQQITDLKTWFNYAPPRGGKKQWKCKRSAMELARYITDSLPDMPDEIRKAFEIAGESETDTYTWQPEYITSLKGKGEGRNHDLAIFGEKIFIGVEAKADEPFDVLVGEWMNNASPNRHSRIDDLCRIAFGTDYKEEYNDLHYQLLSALGGTVTEARKTDKSKAMLLVLVFTSDETDPEKVKQNDEDFEAFVGKVGLTKESIGLKGIAYAGSKKLNGIETWIVKANIESVADCEKCSWKDNCGQRK